MEREEWEQEHQPWERDWHNKAPDNYRRNDAKWRRYWDEVFEWAAPRSPALDVGCGSRPPLVGRVEDAFAIEPLAGEFDIPSEWTAGINIRKQPAEEFIDEFEGRFSYILCWNVLDHTYDPRAVCRNILRYLATGGVFYLATNTRRPDIGHPGVGDRDEFVAFLANLFSIRELRSDRFKRDVVVKAFAK